MVSVLLVRVCVCVCVCTTPVHSCSLLVPGEIWDDLEKYNFDNENKLKLEKVNGKYIKIIKEETDDNEELIVKIKFFELEKVHENSTGRTRVRFIKKKGDL